MTTTGITQPEAAIAAETHRRGRRSHHGGEGRAQASRPPQSHQRRYSDTSTEAKPARKRATPKTEE